MSFGKRVPAATLALIATCTTAAVAQQGRQLTTADYAQAEKFMNYNVNPLVFHGVDHPEWISGDRFWYRDLGPEGMTYTVVDAAAGTKGPAFDHAKLAKALTAAGARGESDPHHLSLDGLELNGSSVVISARGTKYRCDLSAAGSCETIGKGVQKRGRGQIRAAEDVVSPDGTKGAFIRDWNLWVRDVATGMEKQLTTDGVKDYGYATDNAGWQRSDNAILIWSPDSKKIATFQQDQRKDGEMYLVPVTNGHPQLQAWKYPLVGDPNVTMIERVVIDVDSAKVVRLKMDRDEQRSTLCDDISCRGGSGWDDV